MAVWGRCEISLELSDWVFEVDGGQRFIFWVCNDVPCTIDFDPSIYDVFLELLFFFLRQRVIPPFSDRAQPVATRVLRFVNKLKTVLGRTFEDVVQGSREPNCFYDQAPQNPPRHDCHSCAMVVVKEVTEAPLVVFVIVVRRRTLVNPIT